MDGKEKIGECMRSCDKGKEVTFGQTTCKKTRMSKMIRNIVLI